MTGNGYFTSPHPALSAVSAAASDLLAAYEAAQGGGPAQTAAMQLKREVLEGRLTELGHYVEDVTNNAVNSSIAPEVIILSAGLQMKLVTARQKRTFAVRVDRKGEVMLTAQRVMRGTHEWQYTLTPDNPESWVKLDPSSKASVTIKGLDSGKKYFFRHRADLKSGPTEWDGPESTIVL